MIILAICIIADKDLIGVTSDWDLNLLWIASELYSTVSAFGIYFVVKLSHLSEPSVQILKLNFLRE